jgi:hypothetical protein
MKKLLLICSAFFLSTFLNAQSDLYVKIKKALQQTHPELVTDNKLIAINIWSVEDANSRETNKSFEKAYNVYEFARLKGGLRGLVFVTLNLDNLSSTATITLSKDGVIKSISLKAEDVEGLNSYGIENVVFDSTGNSVYKNLSASTVFSSIQSLITR